MKILTIALLAFASITSVLADSDTGAGIIMTPDRPVYCKDHDYKRVNFVQNITRVSENESEIVFQFDTTVGNCQNGEFVPVDLDPAIQSVVLLTRRISFSSPCHSHLDVISPTDSRITMTFDRKRLFKKSNQEWFGMEFMPYGMFKGYFPWRVLVIENSDGAELHIL